MNEKNKEYETALGNANKTMRTLKAYYAEAQTINQNANANSERPLSLDDTPYGEEQIRVEEQIYNLEKVISDIKDSDNNIESELEHLENVVNDANETLDDLTKLPSTK